MKINLYDKVRLYNDKTCTIVEVLEEDTAFIADVDLPGPDWETVEISYNDIVEVMKSA